MTIKRAACHSQGPRGPRLEVIRHRAVGERTHPDTFTGFGQEVAKFGEVAVPEENRAAAVAAVEGVVAEAALGSVCGARHGAHYRY